MCGLYYSTQLKLDKKSIAFEISSPETVTYYVISRYLLRGLYFLVVENPKLFFKRYWATQIEYAVTHKSVSVRACTIREEDKLKAYCKNFPLWCRLQVSRPLP